MKIRMVVFLAVGCILSTAGDGWCLMKSFSEAELREGAELVVAGAVTGRECFWNARHDRIYTRYELKVNEVIAGKLGNEKSIDIVLPGGEVDGMGLIVGHVPRLEKGGEYRLFLQKGMWAMGRDDEEEVFEKAGTAVFSVFAWEEGAFVVERDPETEASSLVKYADWKRKKSKMQGQVEAAYEFMLTDDGHNVHWADADIPVPYYVNEVSGYGALVSDIAATFYRSFNSWQGVQTSRIAFSFLGGTVNLAADTLDGANVLSFSGDLGEGFLAGTHWLWYDASTGEYIEVDIVFNLFPPEPVDDGPPVAPAGWSTDSDVPEEDWDLQSVATHEIGHFCGLGDLYREDDEDIVMYGFGEPGEEKRNLSFDDISGISALYPAPGYVPGSGGGSSGSGCFIATAAYETPLSEEVKVLSLYRDEYLLRNGLGRWFVERYYDYSPALAKSIEERPRVKAVVRVGLRPVVWTAGLVVEHGAVGATSRLLIPVAVVLAAMGIHHIRRRRKM